MERDMSLYLGIDLGTSGLKAVFVTPEGTVRGIGYGRCGIDIPKPGFAEQDPDQWYQTMCEAVREGLRQTGEQAGAVKGLSISGHMHGTVLMDKACALLHPAVLWCDQRTGEEKNWVTEHIGREQLRDWVQNSVNSGFQCLTLLWFRKHEPELFERISHVLLPGDYLRYRLTGEIATERTGAASTLLFDHKKGDWSRDLMKALSLPQDIFPAATHAPYDVAGGLTKRAAEDMGLPSGIPVAYGGGDQPMAMLGNGLLDPHVAAITLGTAGQVCVPMYHLRTDPLLRTNTFSYVPEKAWYVMGATLNACLAYNWFLEKILHVRDFKLLDEEAAGAAAGCDGLLFLPYLTGERTPHLDERARAGFYNLQLSHGRGDMVRAILEGVAFSLLDAWHVIEEMGVQIDEFIISGGGAVSPLWRQIVADVFDRPLKMTQNPEQAGLGAAICAMLACKEYDTLQQACDATVRYAPTLTLPRANEAALYRDVFRQYRKAYRDSKELMHQSGGR